MMKKTAKMCTCIALFFLIFFTLFIVNGYAEDNMPDDSAPESAEEITPDLLNSVFYQADKNEDGTKIALSTGIDRNVYLFLPAAADYSEMIFCYDDTVFSEMTLTNGVSSVLLANGEPADLSALISADEAEHAVTLHARLDDENTVSLSFSILRSSSLRTMYFISSDPESYGRDYVDAAKSNDRASGYTLLISPDGEVDFSGVVTQLKGRGNSTFTKFTKKPYQIKLDKKTELVDGAGKSKKWVLLANAADPTLIRNALTLSIADRLELPYTCKYESVDFYYDGEYRGTYMITEKVEIASSRIEISNTDDLIEEANAENPAFLSPVTKTVSKNDGVTELKGDAAGSIRYVDGLTEPELPEGCSHHAYLLEFELADRYPDELTGFVTARKQRIVTKNPEYMTKEQGMFIANYWQEFEDAVYSENGFNTKTGKYYYEYCDMESLVQCYLVNEFAKNCDYYGSSTYFYLPEDSDIFICGPLWDYDLAYGIGYDLNRNSPITKPEYFYNAAASFGKALMNIQSFRDRVQESALPGGEVYEAFSALCGDHGMIAALSAKLVDSQRMNFKIWDIANRAVPAVCQPEDLTYERAVENLNDFVSVRVVWLSDRIAMWSGDDYFIQTKSDADTLKDFVDLFVGNIQKIFNVINKMIAACRFD